MAQFQCLGQYKTGLGHGAFSSVHQQNDTVYHLEHTLYLTAEISMSGGVDDIDLHAIVMSGSVLCQNCNAAFPFQSTAVHDAVLNGLIGTEYTALLEHLVYQSGLAMVNVGDDSDISQIISNQTKRLLLF